MGKAKVKFDPYSTTCLLIGCGRHRDKRIKFEGSNRVGPGSPDNDFDRYELTTLDISKKCNPDVIHDLEEFPYPFDTGVFDEIHAYECLEHVGSQGDAEFFYAQMGEFWRILKTGGYLCVTVPAWDSHEAWAVPDHKRVIPPEMFNFVNRDFVEQGKHKPMGGDYTELLGDTNFEIMGVERGEYHNGIVLRKQL